MKKISSHFCAKQCISSCIVLALAPALTQAQTVATKKGLWLEVASATINSQKAPTIFDIHGALPKEDIATIKAALRSAGLPDSGSPSFSCVRTDTVDIQKKLEQNSKQIPDCHVKLESSSATKMTISMSCNSANANVSGSGEASMPNSGELMTHVKMNGTVSGQKIAVESQSTSKWISADCSKPPAGISTNTFQMLGVKEEN